MRTFSMLMPFLGLAAVCNAAAPAVSYHVSKSVALGAPDRWDYVTVDSAAHRVYAAHATSIDVIDSREGNVIGNVEVPGANGTAIVASAGKGYAGSRSKKAVLVFDLASLKVIKEIGVDEDTDGAIFDPSSGHVFVMEGDPNLAVVIDTKTDSVLAKIDLGGDPEFAAADGRGKVFINLADKREIVRVDVTSLKVDARWPIKACESPHGLAIDTMQMQLFATCTNAKMVIVDANRGTMIADIPIGHGSDGAAFDPRRQLAFSSNGEGTLSIVARDQSGMFVSKGEIPTQPLARTIGIDPESGRIFLIAADRIETDASAPDPRKRYSVRPGSARLLFVDPTP